MQTLSPLRFLFLLLTTLVVWQGAAAQGFEKMWEREGPFVGNLMYGGFGNTSISNDGTLVAVDISGNEVLRIDGETGEEVAIITLPPMPNSKYVTYYGNRHVIYKDALYVVKVKEDSTSPPENGTWSYMLHEHDADADTLKRPIFGGATFGASGGGVNYVSVWTRFSSFPGTGKILKQSSSQSIYTGDGEYVYSSLSTALDLESGESIRAGIVSPTGVGRSNGGERYIFTSNSSQQRSEAEDETYTAIEFTGTPHQRVLYRGVYRTWPDWDRPDYLSDGPFVAYTIPLGMKGPVLMRDSEFTDWRVNLSRTAKWKMSVPNSNQTVDLPANDLDFLAEYSNARYVVAVDTATAHDDYWLVIHDLATNTSTHVDTIARIGSQNIQAFVNSSQGVFFTIAGNTMTRYTAPPMGGGDTVVLKIDRSVTRIYDSITVTPLVFQADDWTHVRLYYNNQMRSFGPDINDTEGSWFFSSDTAIVDQLYARVVDTVSGRSTLSERHDVTFWRPSAPVFVHRLFPTGILSLETDGRYIASTAYRTITPDHELFEMSLDTILSTTKDQGLTNIRSTGSSVYSIMGDSCIQANQTAIYGNNVEPRSVHWKSIFLTSYTGLRDTVGVNLSRDSTDGYEYYNPSWGTLIEPSLHQRDYDFSYNESTDTWLCVLLTYEGLSEPYQDLTITTPRHTGGRVVNLLGVSGYEPSLDTVFSNSCFSIDCSYKLIGLVAAGDALLSYNIKSRQRDTLVKDWDGPQLFDAIQVDSNTIITNIGIFRDTGGWHLEQSYPFDDAWEVERLTKNYSFVMRHNRDTVGVVVNHFTGEIVQTLGQSIREARSCDYDTLHKLIIIGDDAGVVLGYHLNAIVANDEPLVRIDEDDEPDTGNERQLTESVIAYPSITTDHITIACVEPMSSIEFYSVEGVLVLQLSVDSKSTAEINLATLPRASYFVRVRSGNNWYTTRLIKQ